MAFTKKEWKDRVSQYPNRRTINDGFQTKIVTVGRSEGSVTEAGDSFNAANMNDLENRINEAFTNIVHMPRVNDKAPYQYRQIPVNADRCIEKLIGVSCAFNQLVQNSGISFTSTNSDTRDIFALRIREISAPYTFFFLENLTAPKHIQTIINATASFTGLMLYHDGSQSNIVGYSDNDFNVVLGHKYLLNIDVTGADVQTVGGVSYDDFNIIDLTSCFGSEVADYLYNLENG